MLLSVTGASGVGKSTVLAALEESDHGPDVTCVEFDSIGVPDGADTAWRHGAIEHWVRFAIEEQDAGRHVLLAGQVPPGELLAAPSADRLDAIAVCVLHSSPEVQEARLIGRGEPADSLVHHLRFGAWFHRHAKDPAFQPEVIRVDSSVPMRWDRWAELQAGDARWPVTIIDTDDLSPGEVVGRVQVWAVEQLQRR
ncbi:hypothetical protein [Microbacterium abyssi]|uniref:hypothetical protein n=1 Tax=Microbacterium abyssi TaxID=2782166 RepID=UPI001887D8FA|nr:hypothetical protein [Microbacterium sp. A18JL241]